MLRPIRTALSGAFAIALIAAAAALHAAPPAERELLGVRIWRDYTAVLKRHGEPTRVVPGMAAPPETIGGSINVGMQAGRTGMAGGMSMPGAPMMGGMSMPGAPMMGGMSMPGAPMMGGMSMPGAPMMGGMSSAGGAMGPPGMRGGAMGMGGGRSMPGTSMGMGMPRGGIGGKDEDEDDIGRGGPIAGAGGAPMGAMGGGFRGPMGGAPGMSAPQYGMSAPPGLGGMAGGMMGMAGPMMGGTSGQIGAQSQVPVTLPSEDVKETWVYVRGQHTYYFMFNRDGRVIRIQSFGTKGAGTTSRSIVLGDPLSKVYKAYGWAGATIKQGDSLTLDYSQKAHVVFDLLDRRDGKGPRVVGITIAPTEGRN